MSGLPTDEDSADLPPEDDPWDDELDGPPLEIRKGRESRFKFVMSPQWVLLMTDLPHPAFRLYCFLLAHANAERGDGRVWPLQKTLAELMGYSRRASIDPLTRVLGELDLVEVKEIRYGQNKSRRRYIYTVHEEPAKGWEGIASLQEFYAAKKAEKKAKAVAEAAAASASGDSGGQARVAGKGTGGAAKKPVGSKGGKKPGTRLSRQQAAALRTVEQGLPARLLERLPKYRPEVLRNAILDALDSRTAEQLVARVERRWWKHGYEAASLPGGKGIGSPVGVAVGLVRPSTDCPDPMCEDGVILDRNSPCPACEQRWGDRRTDHRRGEVPAPRPAPGVEGRPSWSCSECRDPYRSEQPADGLCATCRADAQAAAATTRQLQDEIAAQEMRRALFAAEAWDVLWAEAHAEHARREKRASELREQQKAAEERRRADQEQTRLIREQMAREHPELAAYQQS